MSVTATDGRVPMRLETVEADYTILATGGVGGLYQHSTNYKHLTGDAFAIALMHGIEMKDINYVQIHPTTLYSEKKEDRSFLISESVRGEGAKLYDKNMNGGCPVHFRLEADEVKAARAAHPKAQLLVHPECRPEVCDGADYVGSTTGIMDYVRKSNGSEFIIGTENSIVQHLQMECPDKKIYELSKNCICHNMKLTTLADVYEIVKNGGGEEIELADDIRLGAERCLDRMLELGE